jgi:hypothetical protein
VDRDTGHPAFPAEHVVCGAEEEPFVSTPLLIFVKAVNGGLFVALFAVLGEMLQPKRFAGVFGASPAVALANLLIIALVKGDASARSAATGMIAGTIGLAVACAAAVPAVRRWGAMRGSGLLWSVWILVSGATAVPIAAGATTAAGAGLPVGHRARRRQKTGQADGDGRGRDTDGDGRDHDDGGGGNGNGRDTGGHGGSGGDARDNGGHGGHGHEGERLFAVDFGALREIRPRELAVRFAFGFAVSVVAGLIGVAAGQRAGGVMLAAPAVLPATLTIIERQEGRGPAVTEVQGSVPGAVALVGFAVVAAVTTDRLPLTAALLSALATWVLAAIAGYFVLAAAVSSWKQDVRELAIQRREAALARRAQALLSAAQSSG